MTSLDAARSRYGRLLEEIRADLDELENTGHIGRAEELNTSLERPGYLDSRAAPLYFVGNLDAEVVLVHLNPKQSANDWLVAHALEEYFDLCRHFGARKYGVASPRTHSSQFDKQQVRFLRSLGVIPFVEERTPGDEFRNLELAMDLKLQLELIPYRSKEFETNAFRTKWLRPHLARVLEVVAAAPRRYVLFCGLVFERLLRQYVQERHHFHLEKKDGALDFSELVPFYPGAAFRREDPEGRPGSFLDAPGHPDGRLRREDPGPLRSEFVIPRPHHPVARAS